MAMRRCLRRLIAQGGGYLSNQMGLKSSHYAATHDVYFNYTYPTSTFSSLSFYRSIHCSGNPKSICNYRVQRVGGSPAQRKWKEEHNDDLIGIKEGEVVNLSQLLFTETRDYLIRCNDGRQVKAEELAGKVVVIYFDSVSDMDMGFLGHLMDTYNKLQHNSGLEVVFVNVDDAVDSFSGEISRTPSQGGPEQQSEEVFSLMPWTAIPLSDITTRNCLKRRFGVPEKLYIGTPVVVDSTGLVLQSHAYTIFRNYGAQGYPFTDERLDFLESEDDAAARQPSLKALLASPERDYLISNKGDKVLIQTLEEMVVGLYFYNEDHPFHVEFTLKLKEIYEELAKSNKKFEVVLIYICDPPSIEAEDSFWKLFKTMPWLALPVGDLNYKKLERIFLFPWDRDIHMNDMKLVVFGPHMEFMEPFGSEIMDQFEIPAYPFSRQKVARLAAEEAKELKLEMLWDPGSVFGGIYGSQVSYSQLVNKRVIILFEEGLLWKQESKFLATLKDQYNQMKGTDDEFEVIHITTLSTETGHAADLPWLVQQRDRDDNNFRLFDFYVSLIAFDRNGRLVRKSVYPTFEDTNFPFYAGGLEKEALSQAVNLFGWDRYREGFPGMIYSYI